MSRGRAVLGTYVDALCFCCVMYAGMTGERMQYAYVMRGTQKKHLLQLLPPLPNWSDLLMPRSSSTLLSRVYIFGPCINRTIKERLVPKSLVVEWRGLYVFGPLSNFQLPPSPPSPLDDGRTRCARFINTSSVRDTRKGEKVQRTTNERRGHTHA